MRIVAPTALIVIVAALSFAVLQPSVAQVEPADKVFKNGNIYTANDAQPKAEAIAVKYGRIVFVGSNAEVKKYEAKKGANVIDLKGATVVPGLTDAHYHFAGVGFREMDLNLEGTTSLEDFLSKVKARVDKAKPGEWVTGRGWIETFWKPQAFPTRWDLDKIAPNNPVFLTRADGHGAVANSAALKIAAVDKSTPSPFGGEIMLDKQRGEPSGMLLDRAQGLVARHVPPKTKADLEQALLLADKRSLSLGWTQVHDAGVGWDQIELVKKLYGEQKLKIRLYEAIRGPGADTQRLLREGAQIGLYDGKLTIRTIKVSIDGALGSKGAALLENYADHDTNGFLTFKEEQVVPMLEEALKKTIQVETHAIGDRANRTILDWYESAYNNVPMILRMERTPPRWRIEHAQILSAADIPRFAKLGIIPSMQPSHAIGDLHFAPSRLGLKRLEGAYAWQTLIKSGVVIAGGSDAPVERGEPMIEFYAAVARKDQKGFSGEGWHPEEKVTREQALKMFTAWAAYAAFEEKQRGSIEEGKLADLTVLSADIMQIPEAEILKTRCVMTVINGEIVFDSAPVKR
ncbi:MAG TPA: amidohydrolase [Blastocatellia bacterium]|nr:amidohydrolase [Blastocatellia bacterium]HMV85498.1 amidohydrolase [Blastocatellia bacterium]HMX26037.1 amidohydrolase [Blastocatellia bacterium]HMY70310.1 amidohydrolase [Blastocatellia bacterium]HMZ18687.1 amidohydrolase [Blastocatellia bacterium]